MHRSKDRKKARKLSDPFDGERKRRKMRPHFFLQLKMEGVRFGYLLPFHACTIVLLDRWPWQAWYSVQKRVEKAASSRNEGGLFLAGAEDVKELILRQPIDYHSHISLRSVINPATTFSLFRHTSRPVFTCFGYLFCPSRLKAKKTMGSNEESFLSGLFSWRGGID